MKSVKYRDPLGDFVLDTKASYTRLHHKIDSTTQFVIDWERDNLVTLINNVSLFLKLGLSDRYSIEQKLYRLLTYSLNCKGWLL